MKEMMQASAFYRALSEKEKSDLCEAIAEDIYFLDDKLQLRIIEILYETDPDISERIRKINCFTS